MKLVIGAGERRVEGAVHHDVQPLPGIDIVCDFWSLPEQVGVGGCEEIYITHVLEHFPMDQTEWVLRTLNQMLAEGGRMYVEVPNLKWHAEQISLDPTHRKIVEYMYGGQLNEYDFHYNGFTPELFTEDVIEAGFRMLDLHPNSSIEAWLTK